jgi:hypothetical protein
VRDANGQALAYVITGRLQHDGDEPKTFWNGQSKAAGGGRWMQPSLARGLFYKNRARPARGNESPTYAGSSQPTEALFFAFRLKAPGCFFWGCASAG